MLRSLYSGKSSGKLMVVSRSLTRKRLQQGSSLWVGVQLLKSTEMM